MQEEVRVLMKECPVCNVEMDYRPLEMWDGTKTITIQHVWRCSKPQTGSDESHVVEIRKSVI